jgi:hypothetical protein
VRQDRHGERLAHEVLLNTLLTNAACGQFPPADGSVTIVAQPSERDSGVFGFTAHAVIFTDADPDWVRGQLPAADLSAPLSAAFLQKLAVATGRRVGSIDMLCCATSLGGPPPLDLEPQPESTHSRVLRALNYRDEVRTWRADGGIVLIGRGVAGRLETAVEIDEVRRSQGLGRRLAIAARHLIPDGAVLWAQVAPANAASVRAFLSAGFKPVGAEVLLASARES